MELGKKKPNVLGQNCRIILIQMSCGVSSLLKITPWKRSSAAPLWDPLWPGPANQELFQPARCACDQVDLQDPTVQ